MLRFSWEKNSFPYSPVSREVLRYRYFRVLALAGIPTMVVFGLYNWVKSQDPALLLVIGFCFLLLVTGLFLIPKVGRRSGAFYNLVVISYGLMLFYMMSHGGGNGSQSLWMFTYPLVTFFVLEPQKGLIFNILTFASIIIVLVDPSDLDWVFPYTFQYGFRFSWAYLCVFMVSFWFSLHRNRYELSLIDKNKRLKGEIEARKKMEVKLRAALDEVKTLSGFLPICSSCKKIRDDEGYWSQIENYIQEHSNAVFSHSLCPECLRELYPEQAKRISETDGTEKHS